MREDPVIQSRQPNTPRIWLGRAWSWLQAHPVWFAAIAGFLAGWLLPKILAALA